MNDNTNQGTPSTAPPITQGTFFPAQQWYPNEQALIQQFTQKNMPYVFTADGTPIHNPELNLTDPNNLTGEAKKKDDDSDKPSSLDEETSASMMPENALEDGTPRRGKKRPAESTGNWDDTTKVRRQSHNVAEKRRRDKINDKIKELKQLLPKTDSDMAKSINKSYTLEQAIEYIRKLEQQNNSLWEQQQLLQEENRYLKLLRATYNMDEGLDKSKDLEAQLLSGGSLKSSFNGMQVPMAMQMNNGSPSARPSSSPMLVWTQFTPNFPAQTSVPMKSNGALPAQAQLFTAADGTTSFQFTPSNMLRQSNPQMVQINTMPNSNAPTSPKSNSVNVHMFESPKSNSDQ